MTTDVKSAFLQALKESFGAFAKIGEGQSLFALKRDSIRLYIRYSKVHSGGRCFYGLREKDLRLLEGHNSFICLLWDKQDKPLIIPFADFEDVFRTVSPADDGQYKVQVYLKGDGTEFYVAQAGRFSVDGYFGFEEISKQIESSQAESEPSFTHSQIQTLLGAIGNKKNCHIWIPTNDREALDWALSPRFQMVPSLPSQFRDVEPYLSQIDVVWLDKGSNKVRALYEVEHSTPIYSGLLRFNDIFLTIPTPVERFAVVSNEKRRSLFAQQVNRPTFRKSGLAEVCIFFEYVNVHRWHQRVLSEPSRKRGG
jgi:hypothetical protein